MLPDSRHPALLAGIARLIPMKRELKAKAFKTVTRVYAIARLIPMKRELKGVLKYRAQEAKEKSQGSSR